MRFTSEVIVSEDCLSADYELKIEATGTDGKAKDSKVEITHKYPVSKVIDNKGYFHIRKAHDLIIDDVFAKLQKEMNKSLWKWHETNYQL